MTRDTRRRHPAALTALALCAAALLAACGKSDKAPGATQTAARVNKSEITVHQINFVLEQQPGLRAEQAEAASKMALERLIDQELAVQKGEELKLDREPRVVQALEAARRQVIAKAYVDRIGAAATHPDAKEVEAYFAQRPALFKERRIYSLQEVGIAAKREQIPELQSRLQASASTADFVEYLRRSGFQLANNHVIRPAEQIPLNMLDQLARLKDGQGMLSPSPAGAQLTVVMATRSEPVDFERARPAIDQFLVVEQRRKLVDTELKAMRAAAQIEYKGKFAEAGGAGAAAATATAAPAVTAPQAAVQPIKATQAPAAAGELTAEDVAKGMKLK